MSPPWMPLYIADYLADTAHLSAAESGAYLHLIMHYWLNGALPADDRLLARIARMQTGEWRKAKEVLQGFFHDGWVHNRVDKELARAADISSKRRAAVHQRKKNPPSNAPSNDASIDDTRARASQSQRKKDAEASASDAGASPAAPVYSDSRHELWGEGVAILRSLGVAERDARGNIGRWLKTSKDDAAGVLSAIQRARDNRVIDVIPWVTRAISTPAESRANGQKPTGLVAAGQRRIAELDALIAADDEREHRHQAQSSDGLFARDADVRLLPARGRG